ncbi:hypothetical protein NGR_b10050 (plasmid) [Sinorhizobium fredii NGR234]|uniref:Transmembrane protein n=1 Tax=Sinorhizobium fredii (strain NBRC 101917 / NGR234) TaxID=394 RepID=C3KQV0_SINFN|nr:hypothetical protein NGR_b10050 [Sinorhizobium fredii NGR234]
MPTNPSSALGLVPTERHNRGKYPPMSSADYWTILWIMLSLAFGVFLALLTRRR